MRKILLINMPSMVIDDYDKAKYYLKRQSVSNISYGLLSIASYVGKYAPEAGEFKLLDLNYEVYQAYEEDRQPVEVMFEELKEHMTTFQPDIVGISIMFNVSYMYLEAVAKDIKKYCPQTMVIAGGNLATSLYEEFLKVEAIDCGTYGEGELPFLHLTEAGDIWSYIAQDPAFVTREKVRLGIKPKNTMVENLDDLPPIDFGLLEIEGYNRPMTRFFERDQISKSGMTLVIYTTRGCPYNCCFVPAMLFMGKKSDL